MKDEYAEVNGVRLHYVEAGEGPLVVRLHGFSEAHDEPELIGELLTDFLGVTRPARIEGP